MEGACIGRSDGSIPHMCVDLKGTRTVTATYTLQLESLAIAGHRPRSDNGSGSESAFDLVFPSTFNRNR